MLHNNHSPLFLHSWIWASAGVCWFKQGPGGLGCRLWAGFRTTPHIWILKPRLKGQWLPGASYSRSKGSRAEPKWTSTFKNSAWAMSSNISLPKASHRAKHKVNGTRELSSIPRGRGTLVTVCWIVIHSITPGLPHTVPTTTNSLNPNSLQLEWNLVHIYYRIPFLIERWPPRNGIAGFYGSFEVSPQETNRVQYWWSTDTEKSCMRQGSVDHLWLYEWAIKSFKVSKQWYSIVWSSFLVLTVV